MFTEVLVAVVIGGLIFFLVQRSRNQVLKTEDGWWGAGAPPAGEEDVTIRPFKVSTSDEELEDLYRRMDQTRPVPSLEDSNFHYGFSSHYLQKVVSYWRNDFDWRRQVDKLNQYPHFKTTIEGIDIHYLHVKPKKVPEGATAVPLIMVHGWPGSFYEFYGLIPLLTEPSDPDDLVFEVVCPSIPGYGFSEAPHKKGFNSVCAARIFHKLMKRLGFQRFYAHGGDWGWLVTTNMAQLEPKAVKGLHVNFAPPSKPGLLVALSVILGRHFPKLFGFTDVDIQRLFPCMEKVVVESVKESGYMHIQATKPDTVGRALNDSPVGLAAYILEKFSTWTDRTFRNLEDGGLTRKFSLDDLLTNVMIYWTSGCIISSMRFYKENFGKGLDQPHSKILVNVPTGFACFPNELMHTPKLWVKQKYRKLLTFTHMASGGHFAAMEEPQLMAKDIQNFTKTVEKKKDLKDAERLGDELSLQRMKSLSESQRALELERKLFASERLLKQAQSDKIKLQLRVEELQHKYEPKEAKKNLIQRRKKEKLPVDIVPSNEETLHRGEQTVAMEMDVTNTKTAEPETNVSPPADAVSSTQGSQPEPRPAKCVKISADEPVVIPNPSSPVSDGKETEENQQQNKKEERRKKRAVEVIHVSSNSSMENQCAQQ